MLFYKNINTPDEIHLPDIIKYPDGTFKIDLKGSNIENGNTIKIIWQYEKEEELIILAYIVQHIRDKFSGLAIELFMPYLPNARMDRVYNDYEVFTLKYFCKLINELDFDRVTVIDVHSAVGASMLNHAVIESPADYIEKAKELSGFDKDNNYVFFPDEGSCKRYTELFCNCRHIGFGIKKRDWVTGKILGLDICGETPDGRNVFIIDDICSYGGTVYHSAKKLKELGCGNIDVFFTHCENSIEKGELLKSNLIHKIYTTNSICTLGKIEKLTIINCLGNI